MAISANRASILAVKKTLHLLACNITDFTANLDCHEYEISALIATQHGMLLRYIPLSNGQSHRNLSDVENYGIAMLVSYALAGRGFRGHSTVYPVFTLRYADYTT